MGYCRVNTCSADTDRHESRACPLCGRLVAAYIVKEQLSNVPKMRICRIRKRRMQLDWLFRAVTLQKNRIAPYAEKPFGQRTAHRDAAAEGIVVAGLGGGHVSGHGRGTCGALFQVAVFLQIVDGVVGDKDAIGCCVWNLFFAHVSGVFFLKLQKRFFKSTIQQVSQLYKLLPTISHRWPNQLLQLL
jgi:hypothetical protein